MHLLSFVTTYIFPIISVFFSIALHEYVKAFVSTKFYDPLPKQNNRLTLNPLNHFEPIGFFVHLFFLCGWGKPVATSSINYSDKRKGTIMTYTVPSLVNFLVGVGFALIVMLNRYLYLDTITIMLLSSLAVYNVSLAVANLIPIYPFDGYKVLSVSLSPNNAVRFTMYQKFLQIILILLIITNIIPGLVKTITNSILMGMFMGGL